MEKIILYFLVIANPADVRENSHVLCLLYLLIFSAWSDCCSLACSHGCGAPPIR